MSNKQWDRREESICPNCGATLYETIEERWSGKHKTVLSVTTHYLCEICGYEYVPMIKAQPNESTHHPLA